MVLSSEWCENFLEVVLVIAEIPLALLSLEGHGKRGTTGTTVSFTVEYCQLGWCTLAPALLVVS